MKDMLGTTIAVGQWAIWTSHNLTWIGTVTRVCARTVWMQSIGRGSHWRHRPEASKVVIVSELPEAAVFWAIKNG
jgi:hypothetical protein